MVDDDVLGLGERVADHALDKQEPSLRAGLHLQAGCLLRLGLYAAVPLAWALATLVGFVLWPTSAPLGLGCGAVIAIGGTWAAVKANDWVLRRFLLRTLKSIEDPYGHQGIGSSMPVGIPAIRGGSRPGRK